MNIPLSNGSTTEFTYHIKRRNLKHFLSLLWIFHLEISTYGESKSIRGNGNKNVPEKKLHLDEFSTYMDSTYAKLTAH